MSSGSYDVAFSTTPDTFARSCSSFASLITLIWDFLVSFHQEYQQIWTKPVTFVKTLYLFARYFGLIAQITERAILSSWLFQAPILPDICKSYFYFQTICVFLLLAALDGILMLRVYAFYNCDRKMGFFLTSFFVVEVSLNLSLGLKRVVQLEYNMACIIKKTPQGVISLGMIVLATQSVIWLLTLKKHRSILIDGRLERARAPIIQLMFRDGAWVFFVFFVLVCVSIPYTLRVNQLAHVLPPITVSVLSLITCRIIMNMQRVNIDSNQTNTTILDSVDAG